LQQKLDEVGKTGSMRVPETPPLAGFPWDLAQAEMEPKPTVIVAEIAGVLARHAQAEIRAQVIDLKANFGQLSRAGAQAEMGRSPPN